MPLPNANKKSPRVYPLLQNTDLENLAYATLQSTGQPIAIEEQNEDELLRLVLVMLARMSVKGEWNGLLTAGGGGGGAKAYNIPNAVLGATGQFKYWNIATMWAGAGGTSVVALNLTAENQYFMPFIAPTTGAPAGCSIYVNSATTSQNLYVSFYESSSAGYPSTLLGYATISTDSTGAVRVTSFTEATTGSLTFTEGTQYYYAINKSGTETPNLFAHSGSEQVAIVPDNVVSSTSNQERFIESVATTTSAPADVSATTDIQGSGSGGNYRVLVWMDF